MLTYHPALGTMTMFVYVFNVSYTTAVKQTSMKMHDVFKADYQSITEELQRYGWFKTLHSNFHEEIFTNILTKLKDNFFP